MTKERVPAPRTRRRASVTMLDVANHAGVSLGTVSNALNRPQVVLPETRDRIQRSIEELGFVRNRAASSLAAGASNTVGFVMVDLTNSYFVDMARGAEASAHQAGHYLVIANAGISAEMQRTYMDYFNQEQVAGILLAPVGRSLAGVEQARALHRPVVVLDAEPSLVGCCAVSTNNERAGWLAADHLLRLGHRRIVFAGGPVGRSWAVAERLRGAQTAVATVPGATLEHLDTADVQIEDGRMVGEILHTRTKQTLPDGVVAAADLLALGLLRAFLADATHRVPEDVALVACDNNRSAHDSLVPVSTVDLPGLSMGATGMRLLLEEINAPESHQHQHIVLDPSLTARESSIGRQAPPG